jgi:O-antigen/teichoic acid export membrane protein
MSSKQGRLQVLRNIIWHSSEKALRMFIGFFIGLWVARYLGPEQFGRFNYISSWLGMFEAIAWLGVGDTMIRDLVRHREDEDLMMGSAFMIRLGGSLLAVALMLGTAGPLGRIKGDDLVLLAILAVGVPFAQTTGGIWIWFASHTNIGPAVLTKNVSMIIGAIMRCGAIIANAGLIGLMAALSLEYVFWWFFIFGIYVWHGESFFRWRFNVRYAWQMLLTGIPIILSALVASLNQRVDQIMLGRLTSMTDVGVYAAALRFSEIWWVVPPIIVQSLASRYIYSKDIGDQLHQNVARIVAGMALLAFIPCLLMSVLGTEVIAVFLGNQYEGSANILTIHIWTAVLIFIDAPVNQYLLATYRQSQLLFKSIALLVLNFALILVLVPRYGAQGAAVATLAAQAVIVLVLPVLYLPLRDVGGVYVRAISELRPLLISIYRMAIEHLPASHKAWITIERPLWWLQSFLRGVSKYRVDLNRLTLILGTGLCAVFFGLLAVTADPVKIGLGLSLLLGSALLLMPELNIWLILIIGFLFGVLSADPLFSKVIWGISLLSMLLLMPSIMNVLWSKHRKVPGFMLLALAFFFYSIVVSVIQCTSIMEFVAGFKRYFQSFGLMLALTMIVFLPQSYVRWRKFLMVVALLQFPFALYELLVLVPLRGGLSSSSATTDVVAGTFGANLEGGSPVAEMAIYLIIVLAFLVSRWRAGVISGKVFYLFSFICFLPLGMGETKIVVIMLPMVGFILLKEDLMRNPFRYLPSLLVLVLLTSLITYVYVVVIMNSNLYDVISGTIAYNVGNAGYTGEIGGINRWTSITFWFQHQSWYDPMSVFIGNGLGSSYFAQGADSIGGHVASRYYADINLTAASTLLWDTGLIGFIMFLSIFIAAWRSVSRLYQLVSDPIVKADALAIKAAISLFLLDVVYSNALVTLLCLQLIYAVVLGYLGYLMNYHGYFDKRSFSDKDGQGTRVRNTRTTT